VTPTTLEASEHNARSRQVAWGVRTSRSAYARSDRLAPECGPAHDGYERYVAAIEGSVRVDWLAVGLWTGALAGDIAVIAGALLPHHRRAALLAAAGLFLPIGVMGILSIGILFLIAAAVCVTVALLHKCRRTYPDSSAA
jgi:hypothetical protein